MYFIFVYIQIVYFNTGNKRKIAEKKPQKAAGNGKNIDFSEKKMGSGNFHNAAKVETHKREGE